MVSVAGIIYLVWIIPCLTLAMYEPTKCCWCHSLKPQNIPNAIEPQIMPSPFKITVKEQFYNADDEVHVNLESTNGQRFRAFFIGAYTSPYIEGNNPVGQISLLKGQDIQISQDCISQDDLSHRAFAVLSQDDRPKQSVKFVWTPARSYGHVVFRATFVVSAAIFWVSEKSRIIQDPKMGDLPPPTNMGLTIPPISTEGCGTSKGCFREPADCIEPQCLYILTWTGEVDYVEFELGGLGDGSSDRYVAVGLSDDTYMGGDTVFVCANVPQKMYVDRTEVFFSYNVDDPKENIPIRKYGLNSLTNKHDVKLYTGMASEAGSYSNGRLRCRFRVSKDIHKHHPELRSLRGGPVHLLFAHGFAINGSPKRHGLSVEEFPLATADKVDLRLRLNYDGRAKYPLAKAHGCLMILAWIFCASIGLLLTKYYKPMWPNRKIFDQKYWFLGHFNFMSMLFIITIIGIILIFVEAGGYSEAPDLPQKAHPILGIIILVCIIINPILALLRPNNQHDCRPVFNWFHWAFGTIANVLAIPQIFIGMDFGKVMVPWWATWILVIWVIFHIVVELTLEIHQCCTYKKNKERRKKHEQLKREYPKQHHPEPEPAGRRFKRFMLFLHFGITTLITIIMIIIIAVS